MEEIRSLIILCNCNENIIEKLSALKKWRLDNANDDLGGFEHKLVKNNHAFFLYENDKQPNFLIASDYDNPEYKNTNSALQDLSNELSELQIKNYTLASEEDLS